MAAKPIPDGFHTLTPYLAVRGAASAIELYKKIFGAEEVMRLPCPQTGSIMHAELKIGDSILMLADENAQWNFLSPQSVNNTTVTIHMYVRDVDAVYSRAIAAGATSACPPTDMFWGDRMAKIVDPFGHSWGIATHKEDLTPAEVSKRGAEWMAKMAEGAKGG